MIRKNLFIILILLSVIILLISYLYFNNDVNNSNNEGSFSRESKKIKNDEIKKIIKNIDSAKPVEESKSNVNKICDNFDIKQKSGELDEQKLIVKETIEKLKDKKRVNEVLYKYVPKDLEDGYGSHIIPLALSALYTNGDILELGMGTFSTPALNKIAKDQKKFLLSTESEIDWMMKFVALNDSTNHLILSSNSHCARNVNMNKKWGLVFVDHLQAGNRHLDMIKYANSAQIVIAHDSEKSGNGFYLYDRAYSSFKYHCKFSLNITEKKTYISTSMLSNVMELSEMENIIKSIDTNLKYVVCDVNMKKRR